MRSKNKLWPVNHPLLSLDGFYGVVMTSEVFLLLHDFLFLH